ncbi:WD repeat-containing protein 91 homolog isoform X2 [Phalaenopsis equestris]|uniref:WD repeat-containing protein 91 homolog isoform X2 n=1 Tax=Phalaenopsis equestris TaxID=78828 RepID=UPI0009E416CD|nr:WD repeat-containing protein 91 homolog isoform X2 [Phalaenopsis equestris]
MENMQYAEELVREFIVFRGFTNTLQVFERELATDVGRSFQVDKIIELVFSVYVPKYQADKLVSLLSFFKQCFSSSSDMGFISMLSKLELSILRYYIVHALQTGRQDKVVEFFAENGNYLLQRREEWLPWFAIPYLKSPSLDPQFRVYFSKDWFDALQLSFHNILSELFNGTRIPALLKISTEKNTIKRLETDIKQLNQKLSQLQALLETKESEILRLRSIAANVPEICNLQERNFIDSPSHATTLKDIDNNLLREGCHETTTSNDPHIGVRNFANGGDSLISANTSQDLAVSKSNVSSMSVNRLSSIDVETQDSSQMPVSEIRQEVLKEDELPEVSVEFQETFLGHTNPICRCRFSASGTNVASASVDGTVRIWTYGSSTPASKNATIYCGAEIMSLEWECRSDRLLLIGTADGGIKVWNVDAKRVVCDLNTTQEFPSVIDLKCSPVEPIFVSAAASRRHGFSRIDQMGFASLTVWNMKTWKAMATLPLGKDPPAITSLSFNHNGKILAASATDGMIHMFDMSACLQITGWPAHDSAVSSVLFGPDETSIFSLGSDGKIFEWSLQNQGQVLWSRDCSRFCYPESEKICRHEIALDSNGRRLLVTSGSVRSPIYQVRDQTRDFKTLPHTAAITSVDWHPTLPIFITGSADHSVRVTSVL